MSFLKTLYDSWFPGNSSAHKLFWKYRYIFRSGFLDEQEILKNINHPHRLELIKEFKKFNNVKRVLELGCSWGANLFLISQTDPAIECIGIDVSDKMVEAGNRLFKSRNCQNIHLKRGDMISMKNFKDKEFDLIITDASFIYVDNSRIIKCADEMARISRMGLIMVEFDDNNEDPIGYKFESAWVRDYGTLFNKYSSKISKRSFDESTWSGKWSEHGKIITVFLNNN